MKGVVVMKKAVIFDMDGLMIDSERVTYNEYVKKLHMLGHDDFTEEIYKRCLGKNKQGICQVFYDYYGDDFPMVEVWDDVHVWIDESLRAFVPKKKGLDLLLKYLKEHQRFVYNTKYNNSINQQYRIYLHDIFELLYLQYFFLRFLLQYILLKYLL